MPTLNVNEKLKERIDKEINSLQPLRKFRFTHNLFIEELLDLWDQAKDIE